MSIRIAIIGCGFMGSTHYQAYQQIKNADVVALCDSDRKRLSGDWGSTSGNIDTGAKKIDIDHIKKYTDIDAVCADPDIDVVDICLPTPDHEQVAIAAFKAGKHVICEKPLARDSASAARIIAVAKEQGKELFVGQCIRFWPSYAVLHNLLSTEMYGTVRSANFRRISPRPNWSEWLMDPVQSGGCALDMHVHDSDFVNYCFGKPQAVSSHGFKHDNGRIDHIITTYDYGDNRFISSEGSWIYAPDLPFSMTFTIDCEHATITGDHEKVQVYKREGGCETIAVESGDGYQHELINFITCLSDHTSSQVISADSALSSLHIVEAEIKSFENNGLAVAISE